MTPSSRFEPDDDFEDPRLVPGFRSNLWPGCVGRDIPALPLADQHERRCLEFLAAYYRVNLASDQLMAVAEDDAARSEWARKRDEAVHALEALEDRYAPIGFFGEPVMEQAFYRQVEFVRPELPQFPPPPMPHTAHIRIPGLEDIPESELQGPVRVFRWRHGKVDL